MSRLVLSLLIANLNPKIILLSVQVFEERKRKFFWLVFDSFLGTPSDVTNLMTVKEVTSHYPERLKNVTFLTVEIFWKLSIFQLKFDVKCESIISKFE